MTLPPQKKLGGRARTLPKIKCGRKPESTYLRNGTKSLLLAALRVWELRNGHHSYSMADRIKANI
jgi:hypothetical protein